MPDPVLGILTPTDSAKVLARAADKLGVPVPPSDEVRVRRVARAIKDKSIFRISLHHAKTLARVAIAAIG